jgi:hypothetical protein
MVAQHLIDLVSALLSQNPPLSFRHISAITHASRSTVARVANGTRATAKVSEGSTFYLSGGERLIRCRCTSCGRPLEIVPCRACRLLEILRPARCLTTDREKETEVQQHGALDLEFRDPATKTRYEQIHKRKEAAAARAAELLARDVNR